MSKLAPGFKDCDICWVMYVYILFMQAWKADSEINHELAYNLPVYYLTKPVNTHIVSFIKHTRKSNIAGSKP